MAVGTVDMAKVRRKAGGHLLPDDPDVLVVDRAALRKSFARQGQASYWVDLLRHTDGTFQVYRSWRWYNTRESEWVQGNTWSGQPTRSPDVATQAFVDMLAIQAGKGYLVDQRTRGADSPVPALIPLPEEQPVAPVQEVQEVQEVQASEKTKPAPMRRRGDKDWW